MECTSSSVFRRTFGVTLAGDAAHTSTPFAGEGVNCATTDTLALADKIAAAKKQHRERGFGSSNPELRGDVSAGYRSHHQERVEWAPNVS